MLRNVAQGFETKRGRELGRQPDSSVHWSDRSDPGTSPSSVFDRAWARTGGDAAWRRYELLCIRFQENLPIRDIATLRNSDPADLHHDYAAARRECETILRDLVAESTAGRDSVEVSRVLKELVAAIG